LMEEVCERENCKQALRRVKANEGSPGIDGMTVEQLPGHLREHWPAIRKQLFKGTCTPQPVRRVEIPKPDGGVRKLGIPTVLDRFIQQAVMQVLQHLRPQSAGWRTSDEKRDATPHDQAQATGKQREECGGTTMGTEIPGVQLHESQATEEALGAESGDAIQGASSGTYGSDTGHQPRPNGP
jgi:hypothetical protein